MWYRYLVNVVSMEVTLLVLCANLVETTPIVGWKQQIVTAWTQHDVAQGWSIMR